MKTLIILISLLSFTVNAETRLIVPLATTHIGPGEFNNENYGLGIEYKADFLYSATYLANNSYGERSVYLAISKEIDYKAVTFSGGLSLATGYEAIIDSGLLVTPLFAVQYGDFRLVTSFPAAQVFCPTDLECADLLNLQWVRKF